MTNYLLTVLTMVAFAANSVLCRLALGEHQIDASSFTVIRLASGAATLWLLGMVGRSGPILRGKGSWFGALMLFLYATTFSFAYLSLNTGTGALILFGTVQLIMILWSLYKGEHLHTLEWSGVFLASAGLVYLVLPGVSAPSPLGFLLMLVAGIGWGSYSLLGRSSAQPLQDTGANFIRTLPFVILLGLVMYSHIDLTSRGAWLAILSGAIASGMGYAIWYRVLTGLTATQAAVFQLSVPVIAAAGGVIFMEETVSLRLILASLMILGGIALVIARRAK
jgi:drug/metabolite transporter (DMT)-like permease